jgi:hypothetical protein
MPFGLYPVHGVWRHCMSIQFSLVHSKASSTQVKFLFLSLTYILKRHHFDLAPQLLPAVPRLPYFPPFLVPRSPGMPSMPVVPSVPGDHSGTDIWKLLVGVLSGGVSETRTSALLARTTTPWRFGNCWAYSPEQLSQALS